MEQEENITTDSEDALYGLAELFYIENEFSEEFSRAHPENNFRVIRWNYLAARDKVGSPISAKTENWRTDRNVASLAFESQSWRRTSTGDEYGAKKKLYLGSDLTRFVAHTTEEEIGAAPHINIERKELHMTREDLSSMCDMDPEEIIIILREKANVIYKLLDSEITFYDLILLLRIVIKLNDVRLTANSESNLNATFVNIFLLKMKLHISTLHIQNAEEKERNNIFWNDTEIFWKNLLTFFEMIFTLMPNTACELLRKFSKSTLVVMGNIEKEHGITISSDVTESYVEFTKKLSSFASKPDTKENCIFKQPRDNFRDYTVYPTANEITNRNCPFIRPIIKEGAYQSVDHYLDVQFRLLREDFVASLRDGICTHLETKKSGITTKKIFDVGIYEHVQFIRPYVSYDRIAMLVQYTTKKRRPNVNSASFIYGSLVCFTDDNFKNIIFGTIVSNEEKLFKRGQIAVDISCNIVYGYDYTMVECRVFFEPYLHTLKALKSMNESNFPFKKYIIEVNSEAEHPKYINKSTEVSIYNKRYQSAYLEKKPDTMSFKALSLETWPSPEELKLNLSQYKAFQNALTKEFCVIQGPPGTGKTYTTHRIVEFMLNNKRNLNFDGPILVLCYTNHALDQFLEGILNYTDNLVRVGGQSKSTNLSSFNLKQKRKNQIDMMREKIIAKERALCSNRKLRRYYYRFKHESMSFFNDISAYGDNTNYYIAGLEFELNNTKKAFKDILSTIKHYEQLLEDIMSNTGIIDFEYFNIFNNSILQNMRKETVIDWMLEGQIHDNDLEIEAEQYEDDHIFHLTRLMESKNRELDYEDTFQMEKKNYFLVSMEDYYKQILEIDLLMKQPENRNNRRLLNNMRTVQKKLNVLKWRLHQNNNGIILPEFQLKDVYSLPPDARWQLYRISLNSLTDKIYYKLNHLDNEYRDKYACYKKSLDLVEMSIMRNMNVIGMTTTGAARLHNTLQELNCPIVIVEEAAEVLEAHIVASVTKTCEHLILIGDHKQLRPNTAQYELARKFNLDISLFERMVNNKLVCLQLDEQHRMRPEFAKLLVPTIYSHLDNSSSVMTYPPVLGVAKNLFFIDHSHYEETIVDSSSHKNTYEAEYLLKFANYLLMQGYRSNEITILTTYMGQLSYMLKEKNLYPCLKDLNITTVDNFQGEENKIILLSLVRSNENNNIGFLRTENRVCVALSRAKEGFFIIGNMDNLTNSSILWQKIKEVLVEGESLGSTLVLKCQIHQIETKIREHSDFDRIDGGCSLICDDLLECGHNCTLKCHALNKNHLEYKCKKPCIRRNCNKKGHNCPLMCYLTCQNCIAPVATVLQCGHTQTIPCSFVPELYKCRALILKTLPCGHEANILCSESPNDHICKEQCNKFKKDCSTKEHRCPLLCFEVCLPCVENIKKKRTLCTHKHSVMCNEDVDKLICSKKCRKILPCGHFCRKKCFEECGGCNVMVTKIIDICGHSIRISCSMQPDRKKCQNNCPLSKSRGEPCIHKCCEPCPDDDTENITVENLTI